MSHVKSIVSPLVRTPEECFFFLLLSDPNDIEREDINMIKDEINIVLLKDACAMCT